MPQYPDAIHAFLCGVSAKGREIIVLFPGSDDSVAVIARSFVTGVNATAAKLEFHIAVVAGHDAVVYHTADREMRTRDGRRCFFLLDSCSKPMPLFLETFALLFPSAEIVSFSQ